MVKKNNQIGIAPGKDLLKPARALVRVLRRKGKGNNFSALLVPAIEQGIEDNKEEVAHELILMEMAIHGNLGE